VLPDNDLLLRRKTLSSTLLLSARVVFAISFSFTRNRSHLIQHRGAARLAFVSLLLAAVALTYRSTLQAHLAACRGDAIIRADISTVEYLATGDVRIAAMRIAEVIFDVYAEGYSQMYVHALSSLRIPKSFSPRLLTLGDLSISCRYLIRVSEGGVVCVHVDMSSHQSHET
jgi:hypothetical protein